MKTKKDIFGHDSITTIGPDRKWSLLNLEELWAYRELFLALVVRDIKVRYKQTVLGAAWAIIQPITAMIIFSIIFGRLAKIPSEGFPYPVFVYAGLLPWTFFSNGIAASGASLVGSANLVNKVYFPRLAIPTSSVGSGIVDFLISSLILLILMAWYGVGWSTNMLAIPFLMLGVLTTVLGIGMILSALTVSYRDFRYVIPFLVQIWMYLTPVVYPVSFIPEKWRWLLLINPMSGYIDSFRSAYLGKPFELEMIGVSLIMSIFLFIIGVYYFKKVEQRFADII